jgi:hypothetical protein
MTTMFKVARKAMKESGGSFIRSRVYATCKTLKCELPRGEVAQEELKAHVVAALDEAGYAGKFSYHSLCQPAYVRRPAVQVFIVRFVPGVN